MKVTKRVLLTCEHASNGVPAGYRRLLSQSPFRQLLPTHRGYDIGALGIARDLARELELELLSGRMTRLLIDLNRSPHHPRLFSEYSRGLSRELREELLGQHREHWEKVRAAIGRQRGSVVHLGVHSFTRELDPARRGFEVGLLYDPARAREVHVAEVLRGGLLEAGFSVRRNAPYRGVMDGVTTAMRREWSEERYAGLEIEINQELVCAPEFGSKRSRLKKALLDGIAALQRGL